MRSVMGQNELGLTSGWTHNHSWAGYWARHTQLTWGQSWDPKQMRTNIASRKTDWNGMGQDFGEK